MTSLQLRAKGVTKRTRTLGKGIKVGTTLKKTIIATKTGVVIMMVTGIGKINSGWRR